MTIVVVYRSLLKVFKYKSITDKAIKAAQLGIPVNEDILNFYRFFYGTFLRYLFTAPFYGTFLR